MSSWSFPADGDLPGRQVLVLGLGLFGGGEAVVRFLLGKGARVTVADLRSPEQLRESLARLDDLDFQFVPGTPPPPVPGPLDCGVDPTPDGLGCDAYPCP